MGHWKLQIKSVCTILEKFKYYTILLFYYIKRSHLRKNSAKRIIPSIYEKTELGLNLFFFICFRFVKSIYLQTWWSFDMRRYVEYHPCKPHKQQRIFLADAIVRAEVCKTKLETTNRNRDFLSRICFPNKWTFTLSNVLNVYNTRI